MTLEKQVVSFELAKRLKELGVRQDGLFYWIADILVFKTGTGFYNIMGAGMNLHPLADYAIRAFTVAELGEMLPYRSKEMGTVNDAQILFRKMPNFVSRSWRWICAYRDEDAERLSDGIKVCFEAPTEADARAKMLIHLLENNLL